MAIAAARTDVDQSYFADDADYQEELERLRKIEAYRDPHTRRYIEALGIDNGWRCLEVGPGAGSIARWMAGRVGPTGRVVAADLNPRFLMDVHVPHLEVRRHDIANDPIEGGCYDLVHARLVLMHIPDPMRAVRRMVAALRPGGWLLVEDGDLLAVRTVSEDHPDAETFRRAMDATMRYLEQTHTFDPYFGRRLPALLEAAGLADVDNEVTLRIARGGEDRMRPPFARYRDGVLDGGEVSAEDLDIRERCFEDPTFSWIGLSVVAAWGRRDE